MPRGPLRIASITASTIAVLPQVLPSYRATFSDVEVSVETWALEEDVRALVERRVDVAFARAPLDDERLEHMVIADEQICVALPAGHPLCSREKVPLRTLNGFDRVSMRDECSGGFNLATAEMLQEHNVVFRSTLQTGSVETMIGLVASGMGIAIASAAIEFMLLRGVVLRPLQPDFTLRSLCLAWRRDRAELPVIRSFREHVAEARLALSVSERPSAPSCSVWKSS